MNQKKERKKETIAKSNQAELAFVHFWLMISLFEFFFLCILPKSCCCYLFNRISFQEWSQRNAVWIIQRSVRYHLIHLAFILSSWLKLFSPVFSISVPIYRSYAFSLFFFLLSFYFFCARGLFVGANVVFFHFFPCSLLDTQNLYFRRRINIGGHWKKETKRTIILVLLSHMFNRQWVAFHSPHDLISDLLSFVVVVVSIRMRLEFMVSVCHRHLLCRRFGRNCFPLFMYVWIGSTLGEKSETKILAFRSNGINVQALSIGRNVQLYMCMVTMDYIKIS